MKIDEQTEDYVISELEKQGYTEDEILDALVDLEDAEGFDGIYFADGDKKALRQAKKQARKEARAEKKAARQAKRDDKKAAKAEKKAAKSGSGNGLDTAERIGGLVTGLGNTATGFMDSLANLKNSGAQEKVVNNYIPTPPAEEEESSKLPLILGISAAVILVVVVIIIIKKKKK